MLDPFPSNLRFNAFTPLADIEWLIIDTEFSPAGYCLELCVRKFPASAPGDRPLIDAKFCPPLPTKDAKGVVRNYLRGMQRNHADFLPEMRNLTGQEERRAFNKVVSAYVDRPSFISIIPALIPLASEHVLVAHNFAGAERSILRKEFKRYGLAQPEFLYVCTMQLGKRVIEQCPAGDVGYSQEGLGKLLGIRFDDEHGKRHTASGDTKHLAELWSELLSECSCSPFGIKTLGDLLWLQQENVDVIRNLKGIGDGKKEA